MAASRAGRNQTVADTTEAAVVADGNRRPAIVRRKGEGRGMRRRKEGRNEGRRREKNEEKEGGKEVEGREGNKR